MTKHGLKKLHCDVCGTSREVEMGIRTLFCCAQPMREIEEEEEAEEQAPTLKLKPNQ